MYIVFFSLWVPTICLIHIVYPSCVWDGTGFSADTSIFPLFGYGCLLSKWHYEVRICLLIDLALWIQMYSFYVALMLLPLLYHYLTYNMRVHVHVLSFCVFLFKWNAQFNLILITCTVDEVRICLLFAYEYL